MSLYNMLHGHNAYAPVLLSVLGLKFDDIPRYRDCWWDGSYITIHTRTGGDNRDYYDSEQRCRDNFPKIFTGDDQPKGPWNADLRALPTFQSEADDDYDSTYANFYFKMPEAFAWLIPSLQATTETPEQKWTTLLNKMRETESKNDPQVARAVAVMKPLFEQIRSALFGKNDPPN